MPVCKNCHSRISKFDKDICPICGTKDPLSGVTSDTIEITHEFDASNPALKAEAPRKKKIAFMWFALLGWTGAGFVYLRHKIGLVLAWAIANIAIYAGLSVGLALATPLGWAWLGISAGIIYLVNIIYGLVVLLSQNKKDGKGELIH